MPLKERSELRATQVLLSTADRDLIDQLKDRGRELGVDLSGPTSIFRTGLRALSSMDNDGLIRAAELAAERPSLDDLSRRFSAWLDDVAVGVATADPALEPLRGAEIDTGTFQRGTRFVHLSMLVDGRVLISGIAAGVGGDTTGRIGHLDQLFPGAMAQMISMDEEGCDLATSATVAWLRIDDERRLNHIRERFRAHSARALR